MCIRDRIRQMAKDRGNHPFEAVVAYNDQVAIEVIRALNEEGLLSLIHI